MGAVEKGGAEGPEEVHIEGEVEKEGERNAGRRVDKEIGKGLPKEEMLDGGKRKRKKLLYRREKSPYETDENSQSNEDFERFRCCHRKNFYHRRLFSGEKKMLKILSRSAIFDGKIQG